MLSKLVIVLLIKKPWLVSINGLKKINCYRNEREEKSSGNIVIVNAASIFAKQKAQSDTLWRSA